MSHEPLSAVSRLPSTTVLAGAAGAAVLTGGAMTTSVAADTAQLVPSTFAAVTFTRTA